MRSFKIAGALLAVALMISAAVSASAFANPAFLGAPKTLTGTSEEGELKDPSSGLVIKCKKDTIKSGEIENETNSKATVDFEKCTIGGLAAQSLGDKGGVILVPVTGTECYINKSAKEAGTLFTLASGGVHIEVPSLGELLVITGNTVGKDEPINTASETSTITVAGNKSCEGQSNGLLIEKEHSGTTLAGEEVTTESLKFSGSLTLDA